ncbi:pilus assembly PilX family protein [Sideroxyarcus sp. TK5]
MRSYSQGSTLVVTLIVLAMLMLLGVTAMVTSDTAYRLAGNLQFQDIAMNNAEAALVDVEKALEAGTIDPAHADFTATMPVTPSNQGKFPYGAVPDLLTDATWQNYAASNASGNYIIELMSQNSTLIGSNLSLGGQSSSVCSKANTYRITARGNSVRGAMRIVQSYFAYVLPC